MNRSMNHGAFSYLAMALPLAVTGIVTIAENKPVFAQLTPDNTLGAESSIVTPQQLENLIQGGAIRDSALFHSFSEFNVEDGGSVFFDLQNNTDIINIFTRVTGTNSSSILGTLGVLQDALNSDALGNANLFLLNPNGITFGQNANLQLNGSFFATTADGFAFDNFSFSASGQEAPPPLLTINIPRMANFRDNPGNIAVNEGSLIVNEGQNISLVGGNVTVSDSSVIAPDGRIEIGSVGSSGTVSLTQSDAGLVLNYEGIETFRDITFNQFTLVDTSGENGGSLQLQGRNITLSDSTEIFVDTEGAGTGGGIVVNAEEFIIEGGATISTSALGEGTGGNFTINATESVQIIGSSENGEFDSSLATEASSSSTGDAGDITINTAQLLIQNGGFISAQSFGIGTSGNVTIDATESVQIIGESEIGSLSRILNDTNSTGNAGDVNITTSQLLVRDGAEISASTFDIGNGGNLTINATESVQVIGESEDGSFASGLFAQANLDSTGNAGEVTITTPSLLIRDGAVVSASTLGEGNGGNLTVNATDSVQVIGTSADSQFPSIVSVQTQGSGDAGSLTINTSQLLVQNGGEISAKTFGEGNGGNLTINATDSIQVIGGRFPSIVSVETEASGDAGNLTINTSQLLVQNGGEINATTFEEGDVGNIDITADTLILDDGGIIADGNASIGGNITLNISDYIQLLNGNGNLDDFGNSFDLISASSQGNGGNITINTTALIATPGQDSDITANSAGGLGGLIEINADGVLGIQENDIDLPGNNDITVTSGLGAQFSGQVIFNTPQTNPQHETLEEPETVADDSDLITQSACSDFGGSSQLVNSGRGGVPQIPGFVIRNDVVDVDLVDEVLPPPPTEAIKPHHRTDVTFLDSEGEEFKPAMGAVLLPNGMVEFVDYNPAEVYRDMYAAAGCSN